MVCDDSSSDIRIYATDRHNQESGGETQSNRSYNIKAIIKNLQAVTSYGATGWVTGFDWGVHNGKGKKHRGEKQQNSVPEIRIFYCYNIWEAKTCHYR